MSNKQIFIKTNGPITSLNNLIEQLYTNPKWNNIYVNYTYENEACTKIQCAGKRRSFEDLLTLAQTYFPETTELELMSTLKDLKMTVIFCEDIRKIVFFRSLGWPITEANLTDHINIGNYGYAADTYLAEDLINIYNQTL